MTINSADDVLQVCRDRGFRVGIRPGTPPMPYLLGDKEQATEALMAALAAYRPEIIEIVGKKNDGSRVPGEVGIKNDGALQPGVDG